MAKRLLGPLSLGRVRLRLLAESDLAMTLAWRNQDHIRQWFFHSDVITLEQHRDWWERYKDRDDDFVFVIDELGTLNRAVGQVALYNVNWAEGRAEFGRLMIGDAEASGLGLAKLASAGLIKAALGAWVLTEVYLECRINNLRALALYSATGFTISSSDGGVVRMNLRAADAVVENRNA